MRLARWKPFLCLPREMSQKLKVVQWGMGWVSVCHLRLGGVAGAGAALLVFALPAFPPTTNSDMAEVVES